MPSHTLTFTLAKVAAPEDAAPSRVVSRGRTVKYAVQRIVQYAVQQDVQQDVQYVVPRYVGQQRGRGAERTR